MQAISFTLSAVLALSGLAITVFGITIEEWKAGLTGVAFLSCAGVFATLFVGTRWGSSAKTSDPGESSTQ